MTSSPTTNNFIRLLTNHQASLRGLIISMAPGCQDVNDILQETNIVLWEKMGSYKDGSDFKAWAYAVARNKVMQYWDESKKLQKITLSEELVSAIEDAGMKRTPEALNEKLKALGNCLNVLKPAEKEMIEYRYSSGESIEEFSSKMGRTAASLRVTMHRIRQKLRKCVSHRLGLEGGQR